MPLPASALQSAAQAALARRANCLRRTPMVRISQFTSHQPMETRLGLQPTAARTPRLPNQPACCCWARVYLELLPDYADVSGRNSGKRLALNLRACIAPQRSRIQALPQITSSGAFLAESEHRSFRMSHFVFLKQFVLALAVTAIVSLAAAT